MRGRWHELECEPIHFDSTQHHTTITTKTKRCIFQRTPVSCDGSAHHLLVVSVSVAEHLEDTAVLSKSRKNNLSISSEPRRDMAQGRGFVANREEHYCLVALNRTRRKLQAHPINLHGTSRRTSKYSTLQHTATYCNTLQNTATHIIQKCREPAQL